MPVDDSRLSGFYKLSVEERRNIVARLSNLSDAQIEALSSTGELEVRRSPSSLVPKILSVPKTFPEFKKKGDTLVILPVPLYPPWIIE